jgi:cytoskeletal protein CcmA (bactofilin family)
MLKSTEKKDEINSISSGSKLTGDLVSSGDVRIDGHLKGSITTEGRLVLGEGGIIDGQIKCQTAIIGGQLKATITAEELLTLKSTAKLSGEIIAGQLAIEPGAVFTGKCSMGPIIKKISKGEKGQLETEKEKSA